MTTKTKPAPKTAKDLLRRRCVFCEKSVKEVKKMIESANTGAMICDECVSLCVEILVRG